jgi:hypothetical protein
MIKGLEEKTLTRHKANATIKPQHKCGQDWHMPVSEVRIYQEPCGGWFIRLK